ncbi:MAG: hypothetical protein WBA51_09435 [Erythrobacter sp.]
MAAPAKPEELFDPLTGQIMAAARSGLELVAIGMAVSLPHYCSALSNENGRSTGANYKQWCRDNLTEGFLSHVTPEHLYSFRCGLAHQGRLGDLPHDMTRIIFLPPESGAGVVGRVGDAYLYGVIEFCETLSQSAADWFAANKDRDIVRANAAQLMKYYSGGFPPYSQGFPVIA